MSGHIERVMSSAMTIALLLALGSAGCATYTAPKGWLPMPAGVPKATHGAWLHVEYRTSSQTVMSVLEGEFIAYGDSAVYLLGSIGATRIPIKLVELARLEIHDHNAATYAIWTALGTLSTITHGWVLIATAPIWIVTGTVSAVAVSKGGRESKYYPDAAWWQSAGMFARFPQGLPKGIQLKDLRKKP